jgi:hypothetical protein
VVAVARAAVAVANRAAAPAVQAVNLSPLSQIMIQKGAAIAITRLLTRSKGIFPY